MTIPSFATLSTILFDNVASYGMNDNKSTDSSSSSSSVSTESSSSLLNPNPKALDADFQGINLLQEIFPDESLQSLKEIHATRLQKCHYDSISVPNSTPDRQNFLDHESNSLLPSSSLHHQDPILEMEERVLQDHHQEQSPAKVVRSEEEEIYYFTAVVYRDSRVGGLGMTLNELPNGDVQVCDLKPSLMNPSANAGIRKNDILIGINGTAFVRSFPIHRYISHSTTTRMKDIVLSVQQSSNPIILHFQRATVAHSRSLLDASDSADVSYVRQHQQRHQQQKQQMEEEQTVHRFASVLAQRKLITSKQQQLVVSKLIRNFHYRAQQWEATTSLTTPSTPYVHIYSQHNQEMDVLDGIRKSLSTRIVNCFIEEADKGKGAARLAYTIWVYDVESGKEWYAPLRYFEDFEDLRATAKALAPRECKISELPFPMVTSIWDALTSRRQDVLDEQVQQESCRKLEFFLRVLCRLVYTSPVVNANVAKIAIHVQSFLGTEVGLSATQSDMSHLQSRTLSMDYQAWNVRQLLKRSLQRYMWRLFQLDIMQSIVNDFVDAARARAPSLKEIETLEAQGRDKLKGHSIKELKDIRIFLDELVNLLLEGCRSEMELISERSEYEALREEFENDESKLDRLSREATREQVEIEVYVPLRSVVSRLLVHGWRHDDMEVQLKSKELIKRPQSEGTFRIPRGSISPSQWESVAFILRSGVGTSTLPCIKLQAIVDAAREVSRLHAEEHGGKELVGADDFLPVFIFCVVKANLERPCALCVLLTTLCDKMNAIGEIGYFLASFEAVIAHLRQLNPAEDPEEVSSTALSNVPLNE